MAKEHKNNQCWNSLQNWFLEKLADTDGGLMPLQGGTAVKRAYPELDYQVFLENASRTMIRFRRPERLIRMIVRVIDERVRTAHTAILLYKEQKNSFILIDSKGEEGVKIPVGFIRMTHHNPLIRLFTERKN